MPNHDVCVMVYNILYLSVHKIFKLKLKHMYSKQTFYLVFDFCTLPYSPLEQSHKTDGICHC